MSVFAQVVRVVCWIFALGAALLLGAVWLIPLEVLQSRAIERAGEDPFAQFEAAGQAEALVWLLRVTAPVGLLLFWPSRMRAERVARWFSLVAEGLVQATRPASDDSAATSLPNGSWRSGVLLGVCLAWAVLAMIHFVGAVDQRTRDWPIYRLKSGAQVLPNISDSNRMVIRYLNEATPEDARILVLSDQKLFFLSYYLLPRRVYHPIHPEAEFVIPEPEQQRPLAAYRLSDLDDEYLDRINPDYVLEYFEGPEYVDSDRLLEDAGWIAFARERNQDAGHVPPYMVVLRRWNQEDDAP